MNGRVDGGWRGTLGLGLFALGLWLWGLALPAAATPTLEQEPEIRATFYIFFANKTACLAWVTLFTGVFNVVAIYLLINVNRVVGVAQAFMLSMALKFIGTWFLSHKVRPMPWKQALLPLRSS